MNLRSKRWADLVAIAIISSLLVIFSLTRFNIPLLRLPLGIIFVLFIPGYAVVNAVYPRKSLEFASLLAYSIGSSIAILALGGVVLHGVHLGLRASAWILLLGAITLMGSAVTIYRRSGLKSSPIVVSPLAMRWQETLLFSLGVLIFIGVIIGSVFAAKYAPDPTFTEFWMDVHAEDATLDIGITNREQQPIDYRMVMTINGLEVEAWEAIHLADGATWETTLPIPAPAQVPVKFMLFRLDAPDEVYRWVQLNNQ